MSKVVATIEARMTSSRLPGKVLLPAGGEPLLATMIRRVRMSQFIDDVVVATTTNDADQPIVDLALALNAKVFRGSESDVLGRVLGALLKYEADICVELTGDCPLIDPAIIDFAVREFHRSSAEHPYVSNSDPERTVPHGQDVQVFLAKALGELEREVSGPEDREHVTLGFYRSGAIERWRPRFLPPQLPWDCNEIFMTLDYEEDYELIRAIHEALFLRHPVYNVNQIVDFIHANPELHNKCVNIREQK